MAVTLRLRTAAGLTLLLGGLAACSGDEEPADSPSPEQTASAENDPTTLDAPDAGELTVLVRTQPAEGAEDALVSGRLAAVGSCLGIERDGSTYPLVLPAGTTVSGVTVVLPNGDSVEYGEDVQLGGGYHSAPLPAGVPDVPQPCATDGGEVAVVNDDG